MEEAAQAEREISGARPTPIKEEEQAEGEQVEKKKQTDDQWRE